MHRNKRGSRTIFGNSFDEIEEIKENKEKTNIFPTYNVFNYKNILFYYIFY